MKKYELFDEFCKKELYGDSLGAALRQTKELPRPPKIIDGKCVPQSPVTIIAVLGTEKPVGENTIMRGSKPFDRVIVRTEELGVISVDGRECDVVIGPV